MSNPAQKPSLQVPASLEAEQAVLGAVLCDPRAYYQVADILVSTDFFLVRHQYIWQSINKIMQDHQTLDFVTLGNQLDTEGKLEEMGGNAYLTNLVNNTPSSVHAEIYAELVRRASVRRQTLDFAEKARTLALDEDLPASKLVGEIETLLYSIDKNRQHRDFVTLDTALSDYYEHLEGLVSGEGLSNYGVPTGYKDIDVLLGGLQRSDFIVFAGRTGMGKTSWLLSTAINVARRDVAVVVFTMEMSIEQIVQRFIAMQSGITIQDLRNAKLSKDDFSRFVEVVSRLAGLPIYLDDSPALTPRDIKTRCKRLQHEKGLSAIIIDYMQLMSMGKSYRGNRVQEVSSISRMLKGIARDLNVPVLAAAQLSRAVEYREDKRPILSDLRESGSIEQDADAVLFMYRDDYYNQELSEFPGLTEIHLAKHRHGPTGTVRLYFNEATTSFSDAPRMNSLDL